MLEIYEAAVTRNLDRDFIEILEKELQRRGIETEQSIHFKSSME